MRRALNVVRWWYFGMRGTRADAGYDGRASHNSADFYPCPIPQAHAHCKPFTAAAPQTSSRSRSRPPNHGTLYKRVPLSHQLGRSTNRNERHRTLADLNGGALIPYQPQRAVVGRTQANLYWEVTTLTRTCASGRAMTTSVCACSPRARVASMSMLRCRDVSIASNPNSRDDRDEGRDVADGESGGGEMAGYGMASPGLLCVCVVCVVCRAARARIGEWTNGTLRMSERLT